MIFRPGFNLFNTFVLVVFSFSNLYSQTERIVMELYSVDTSMQSFMKKWKIHGGSVALVKDEKLIYARSFGTDKYGKSIHNSTLFNIASLSKPITAVAILKLAEAGKLKLDGLVFGPKGILKDSNYIIIADKRVYRITIRQLLQHTGGWDRNTSEEGDPMFNPYAIAKKMEVASPATKEQIIQYMLTKKLDFNPGNKFSYSNLGYNVLGRVIEKITGQNYENYIQENVLKPMGINDMRLALNEEFKFDLFKSKINSPLNNSVNIESMDAHGGWKATSSDMVKFLIGKDLRSNNFFLNKNSQAMMTKGSLANRGYGLGWFVNEKGNYWHTGSIDGASAFMARLSNGLCAVVLLNDRPSESNYFKDLDQVVWSGLKTVKQWPVEDLFTENNIAVYHDLKVQRPKSTEEIH